MRTVHATPELVPFLLARMGEDRVARMRQIGLTPETDIPKEIAASTMTWCGIEADGGVVNMGGIVPIGDGVGYLWQYITNGVQRNKRAYIEQGHAIREKAFKQFNRVETLIEVEYRAALRHAARCGLTPGQVEDFKGFPVHRCRGVA